MVERVKINFDKIIRNGYIDEIKNFNETSNKVYNSFQKKQDKKKLKIQDKFNAISKNLHSSEELEIRYSEYQYDIGLLELSIYRILASLYIGLFSIWELQVINYNRKIKKYYNEKMKEFAFLVNTLKHGKEQLNNKESSYQKLKTMNSDFLKYNKTFSNIYEGMFSGIIMNISIKNFNELCDEMIDIWNNLK